MPRGGKRPGAGRKPKPKVEPVLHMQSESEAEVERLVQGVSRDPLEFLLDVMQGKVRPSPDQLKAAVAATQYVHTKKGEGGKKDAAKDAAVEVAKGRFRSGAPPLRAVK
jgi:phage terminase small subunit